MTPEQEAGPPPTDAPGEGIARVVCPGCGLSLPDRGWPPDDRLNATGECRALYWELSTWSLMRGDSEFSHQTVVDAYGVQHAGEIARSIAIAFPLIGLCLALEQGYTGREVQLAHVELGRQNVDWPRLRLEPSSGLLTVRDVLDAEPPAPRDARLRDWARQVWEAHPSVHDWTRRQCDERL